MHVRQKHVTPHAFRIPVQGNPSPSEFQDAACGMVWTFSGVTHFEGN